MVLKSKDSVSLCSSGGLDAPVDHGWEIFLFWAGFKSSEGISFRFSCNSGLCYLMGQVEVLRINFSLLFIVEIALNPKYKQQMRTKLICPLQEIIQNYKPHIHWFCPFGLGLALYSLTQHTILFSLFHTILKMETAVLLPCFSIDNFCGIRLSPTFFM